MAKRKIGDPPLPYEMIFSCHICQATISEIYQEPDNNKGIHDDDSPEHETEREVNKLWLTECCHLVCGLHLEGGGAPFHPKGELPKAPCPVCVTERNHQRPVTLYSIRGFVNGRWDTRVPQNWFDTPPFSLDGQGKGMDALRFHYLSLIRFGTGIYKRFQKAQIDLESLESKISNDKISRSTLENEISLLKASVKNLEKCEAELRPWKEREPKIKHYLGVVTEMARENEKLREQLESLGYAVPRRMYSMDVNLDPERCQTGKTQQKPQSNADRSPEHPNRSEDVQMVHETWKSREKTSSSHTPYGSFQNTQSINEKDSDHLSKNRKMIIRDWNDAEDAGRFDYTQQHRERTKEDTRASSRSLMPPPPLPTLRKIFSPPLQTHNSERAFENLSVLDHNTPITSQDFPLAENVQGYQCGGKRRLLRPVEQETYCEGPQKLSLLTSSKQNEILLYRPGVFEAMDAVGDAYIPDFGTNSLSASIRHQSPLSLQSKNFDAQKASFIHAQDLYMQSKSSYAQKSSPGRFDINRSFDRRSSGDNGSYESAYRQDSSCQEYGASSYPMANTRVMRTPSPQKQFTRPESVASPFFKQSKAPQYHGPIRISERILTPQSRFQMQSQTQQAPKLVRTASHSSPLRAKRTASCQSYFADSRDSCAPQVGYDYGSSRLPSTPNLLAPSIPRNHLGLFTRPYDRTTFSHFESEARNRTATPNVLNSQVNIVGIPNAYKPTHGGSMSGISRPSREHARQRSKLQVGDFLNQTGYHSTSGRRTARR